MMVRMAFSPFFMVAKALSQPWITSPEHHNAKAVRGANRHSRSKEGTFAEGELEGVALAGIEHLARFQLALIGH